MRKGLILGIMLAVVGGMAWGSTQASRQYNFEDDRDNNIPIRAARVDAELDNIITKMNQKVLIKSTAPSAPVAGMLWYDSTNKLLKQYRNSEWVGVGVHVSTTSPATAQEGDVWYDTTNNIMKLYNGSTWDITLPEQTGHPNSYLRTDGSSADWDQISLDANIYGILPVANGGTGANFSSIEVDNYLYFSSTGTLSARALEVDSAIYPTAGTFSWKAPAGVNRVFITAVGAGGGGGGGTTSGGGNGGGGGSGAYYFRIGVQVTAGNSYTVTVGDGGAGGVSVFGGSNGSDGGSSSFAGDYITLTANGGKGALKDVGGLAGAASGSAFTPSNSQIGGGSGLSTAGAAGCNKTSGGYGGGGAGSPFGTGGLGDHYTFNVGGGIGKGWGSGGGGGHGDGPAGSNGGKGAPGMVLIEW